MGDSEMQLIQSYIFSVCRSSLSLYEQRIILRIVEHAQTMFRDMPMKTIVGTKMSVDDNIHISLMLRDMISSNDRSKHYDYVRAAFVSLMSRKIDFWDADNKVWYGSPVIYNCTIVKASGKATFYVSRMFLCALLDFTKGYSQYSLEVALSLKSPYSVRLYMLLCNQRHPLELSIDQLRRMLCPESAAYQQSADFIKRIIQPAKDELDKRGCNSFDFTKKSGRYNRTSALLFHPIKREVSGDTLRSQVSVSRIVDRHLWIILTSEGGFSYRELSAHKKLWEAFQKCPDCLSICLDIINRARAAGKSKGWIIQAIRSECAAYKILV